MAGLIAPHFLMKSFRSTWIHSTATCLFIALWAAGSLAAQVSTIPVPALPANARLALCGDSITEQRLYTKYVEIYLKACAGRNDLSVFQFGWGGENADQFINRINRGDLDAFVPTAVTYLYGANDGASMAWQSWMEIMWTGRNNGILSALAAKYPAAGSNTVMCSPTYFDLNGSGVEPSVSNDTLGRFRDLSLTMAQGNGKGYADVRQRMMESGLAARAALGTGFRFGGNDGVHAGPNGQLMIAHEILTALSCDGAIATIHVDMSGSASASAGHTIVSSSGGAVTVDSTRYPFCYNYDGSTAADRMGTILPYLPFSQNLNRFMLVVSNLGQPFANVTWGNATRTFTREQLSAGVNLAEQFTSTPFDSAFSNLMGLIETKQIKERDMIKAAGSATASTKGWTDADVTARNQLDADVAAAITAVRHTITVAPAASGEVVPAVSSASANGTVGSAFSYQVSASNSPASYGATNLPAGLTINATSGLVSGTPTAAGTTQATISATNASGTGSGTLTITVAAATPTPVVTSALTASGTAGSAFSYQIATTNSPIKYYATGLPSGLNLNSTTGLISGIPAAAGTTSVLISAENAGGNGAAVTLALTIAAAGSGGGGGAAVLPLDSRIIFLGDSITAFPTMNSFVNWSLAYSQGRYYPEPGFNKGAGGETSANMLSRINDVTSQIRSGRTVVVVLAGANTDAGGATVTQTNLRAIYDAIIAAGGTVAGVPTLPFKDAGMNTYANAVADWVRAQPDIAVVDTTGFDPATMKNDNTHPNLIGGEFLGRKVAETLRSLISGSSILDVTQNNLHPNPTFAGAVSGSGTGWTGTKATGLNISRPWGTSVWTLSKSTLTDGRPAQQASITNAPDAHIINLSFDCPINGQAGELFEGWAELEISGAGLVAIQLAHEGHIWEVYDTAECVTPDGPIVLRTSPTALAAAKSTATWTVSLRVAAGATITAKIGAAMSRKAIESGASSFTISGTPVTTAQVGEAYAGFAVSAVGGTSPYTYSLGSGSLPPGLTLNTGTGAVSGTPTTAGTYSGIVLRATDAASATADLATFQIVVAPPGAPANTSLPAISGVPTTGQTISVSNGTWTNSPTGFTYQWQRAGGNISGATLTSYTLAFEDEGTTLSCEVLAANPYGSTMAETAAFGPVQPAPSGQPAVILFDDFSQPNADTGTHSPFNVYATRIWNGAVGGGGLSPTNGTSPGNTVAGTNLPGGTWQFGGGAHWDWDAVEVGNLNGYGASSLKLVGGSAPVPYLSLKNNENVAITLGSYNTGGLLTVSVNVAPSGNDAYIGFDSALNVANNFSGLKLDTNGGLTLIVDGSQVGSSVAFTGTFEKAVARALTFTVNTSTGALSGVAVQGSSSTYAFSTAAFTSARTPYFAFYVPGGQAAQYAGLQISWTPGVPATPSGLSAGPGPIAGQIALAWIAVSGATGYVIQRSALPDSGFATIATGTDPAYTDSGLAAAQTYYYRVSATSSGGASAYGSVSSADPYIPPTFEGWTYLHFGPDPDPDVAADDGCPAGDGLPNLLKYALDLDPWTPSTFDPRLDQSGGAWRFEFERPASRPDLIYAVETSPSLAADSWSSDGVNLQKLSGTDPETWSASCADTGQQRLFFRLKVARAPAAP